MKFKLFLGVIVLAVIAWGGWWWVASSAQKAGLEAWLDDRRAQGWQAETLSVDVGGFPNRLDARLSGLRLADPQSGWAWDAPFFDIYQIVYNPTEVIAVWPPEQRIAAPGARATVRTETMRASAKFSSAEDLTLQRNSAEVENGSIAADAGWTAGVARYNHHLRAAPGAGPENAYEFITTAEGLRLPDFVRRRVDPADALPASIELIKIEGKAAFDRPLDRRAIEGAKPQVTALSLKPSEAKWGELALTVSGAIKADDNGFAEGEMDFSAKNWTEMLDAAVAAGALQSDLAGAMKVGLGLLARLSGDRDTLSASITFNNGSASIGPVPIGPAPRLVR